MSAHRALITTAFLMLAACSSQESVTGEQGPDMDADVSVATPRYEANTGPIVLFDGAHQNLHTIEGSYAPFAQLLRNDGLRVAENENTFTLDGLSGASLLIIANAETDGNSAFTPDEIAAVREYVEGGGSLLLIADHMPYPLAVQDLAANFGAEWLNVYSDNTHDGRVTRRSGDLVDDPITGDVTRIRTFGGSCFIAPDMRPLLRAGETWSLQTEDETGEGYSDKFPADGCLIGAVAEVGEGRIAFFAEGAMFSAQILAFDGRTKLIGFNAPHAGQNRTFILNIVHWLVGAD